MKYKIYKVYSIVLILICITLAGYAGYLKSENAKLKSEIEIIQSKDVELSKCYLCGSDVQIFPVNEKFYIMCKRCGLKTDYFESKSKLIQYWNRRNGDI